MASLIQNSVQHDPKEGSTAEHYYNRHARHEPQRYAGAENEEAASIHTGRSQEPGKHHQEDPHDCQTQATDEAGYCRMVAGAPVDRVKGENQQWRDCDGDEGKERAA
jgi:hypothetical protein